MAPITLSTNSGLLDCSLSKHSYLHSQRSPKTRSRHGSRAPAPGHLHRCSRSVVLHPIMRPTISSAKKSPSFTGPLGPIPNVIAQMTCAAIVGLTTSLGNRPGKGGARGGSVNFQNESARMLIEPPLTPPLPRRGIKPPDSNLFTPTVYGGTVKRFVVVIFVVLAAAP